MTAFSSRTTEPLAASRGRDEGDGKKFKQVSRNLPGEADGRPLLGVPSRPVTFRAVVNAFACCAEARGPSPVAGETFEPEPSMHARVASVLVLSLLALGACQSQQGTPTLESDAQKASYGVGFQMGGQLQGVESHLDMAAFMAGVRDGMGAKESAVPQEEVAAAFEAMNALMQEEEMARMAEEGEKNSADGAAFLAENATKEGVMVTESGLQYEVLREGDGARPGPEDQVSIQYKGTLIDGTQFDSSYDRGEPSTFAVGSVIPGFSEGLQLMPVGSHYRFFVPSNLGYGPQGTGGTIGPNATLIFEVELLDIVQ